MTDETAMTTRDNAGSLMESVLIKGDLSKLSPEERSRYYTAVCNSVGLNPLTRPLEYLTLNGKLTLYARRDAADQLRKINGISLEIVERSVSDGLLFVHVRAKDRSGRTDEDLGVVSIAGLKGDAAANAVLKGITKAKRRVTLSISGMGFLDETEVEDIPEAAKVTPAPHRAGNGFRMAQPSAPAAQPPIDVPDDGPVNQDGEIVESPGDVYFAGALADIMRLGEAKATDKAFAVWATTNKPHIDALPADKQQQLRNAFKDAKAQACKLDAADVMGAGE